MSLKKAPSVPLVVEGFFVFLGEIDTWIDISSTESRVLSIFGFLQEPSNIRSELDSNEVTQCSADEFVTTILDVESTGKVKAGEIPEPCFRGVEYVMPFRRSCQELLSNSSQLSSEVVWVEESGIEKVVCTSIESRTQMESPSESIGRFYCTHQVVDPPRSTRQRFLVEKGKMDQNGAEDLWRKGFQTTPSGARTATLVRKREPGHAVGDPRYPFCLSNPITMIRTTHPI